MTYARKTLSEIKLIHGNFGNFIKGQKLDKKKEKKYKKPPYEDLAASVDLEGDVVSEKKMTKKQMKKRDEIADAIGKKDMKKRYGDENVRYAIATKLAMKENITDSELVIQDWNVDDIKFTEIETVDIIKAKPLKENRIERIKSRPMPKNKLRREIKPVPMPEVRLKDSGRKPVPMPEPKPDPNRKPPVPMPEVKIKKEPKKSRPTPKKKPRYNPYGTGTANPENMAPGRP